MSTRQDVRPDRPLAKKSLFLLACTAGITISFFYIFALTSLLLLLTLLAFELILALAAARFGMATIVGRCVGRHAAILPIFLRSFWLGKTVHTRLPLIREDAPKLFAMLQKICEKAKVPFPNDVFLEMNAGAWVRLRGYRRGAGKATLGIGYDLLAGLSESEIEAVLAHEVMHARLVQRGLSWWLGGGVARSIRLARGLSEHVDGPRNARREDDLAVVFLRVAQKLARQCGGLIIL